MEMDLVLEANSRKSYTAQLLVLLVDVTVLNSLTKKQIVRGIADVVCSKPAI